MEISREILQDLVRWRESAGRKPLILQGARQVGKTWILKHFGARYFENTAYFNFDLQTELKDFFQKTKEPERIIEFLSIVNGSPILPQKTLVIFDEIQECNDALNSLKYFRETHSEYVIAGAGSLLGVALTRGASFPVGNVDFLKMYPLTFKEFLAHADQSMHEYLSKIQSFEPIPEIFFSKLIDKLKQYFISGGMPEAVSALLEDRNTEKCQNVLQSIINAYTLDFSKHIDNKDVVRVNYIWSSLPSQLARENKKFLYHAVRPGSRAREYEDALTWLVNAGLVYKIHKISKPGLPLKAYEELTSFKIYLSDTAILRKLSMLDPVAITEGNRLFTEFKGALTENFVLNSLLTQFEAIPFYWKSSNEAEVDFIVQFKNSIIPIEVKSDENVRSKSLAVYRDKYKPAISVRVSLKNLELEEGGFVNIPLFMTDYLRNLIRAL